MFVKRQVDYKNSSYLMLWVDQYFACPIDAQMLSN